MRSSIATFTKIDFVEVQKTASSEQIITINEDKASNFIAVTVQYLGTNGDEIGRKDFLIAGSNYESLMSESPAFAPGKPANEYREVDIWHIIDQLS